MLSITWSLVVGFVATYGVVYGVLRQREQRAAAQALEEQEQFAADCEHAQSELARFRK